MGNVCCNNINLEKNILKEVGLDFNSFKEANENLEILNNALHRNDISLDEFISAFCLMLNVDDNILKKENLWEKYFNPVKNEKVYKIIETLKKNGNKVVCLTDTLDIHYKIHEKNKDYLPFSKVYSSNNLHMIKLDREIFEYVLKQENYKPQDVVFIDDSVNNCSVAKSLNINTHKFVNAELLELFIENIINK